MRTFLITTAVLFGSAYAVSGFAADDCANPQSQKAMSACVGQEYEREDALLNRNYKVLMNKLDTRQRKRIKPAQLAWVKFRDLQCDFEAARYEGGTMYSLARSNCLSTLTKQRNKALQAMLEEAAM